MSAPRIGLLGSWKSRFPSVDASYSSLDTVTWQTARALRRRGRKVVVGGADITGAADDIELVRVWARTDGWLRRLLRKAAAGPLPRWSSRHHHPLHLLGGVQRLREFGVDAIQVTHEYANLLPARLLARDVPLVTQLHAVWVDDYPALGRRLLEADAVTTVSEFVRRAVCEIEPRLEQRTFTVRNGVNLEDHPGREATVAAAPETVATWRRQLDARNRPLLVAANRVTPEKGHHVLAEASALLDARGYDVVVAVAGALGGRYERPGAACHPFWQMIEEMTDGYTERLRSLAGGAAYHLLGELTPSDLKSLLAAADLFVAPSLAEPFGLPVMEALAMDVPVVASEAGAYPEIVGDAGVLVPVSDAAALAEAIANLLDRPASRDRLARRARNQAARHTWDRTAETLEQVVAQLQ
jgi:glycosyltransferase involved in cell wall biosynthesis